MEETIRAVDRGFHALAHLSRIGTDSGPRIAAALDLSRPTTYRILATLEGGGLVRRDPGDGRFSLTRDAGRLNAGATLKDMAVWASRPTLSELQRRVVWTNHVATLGVDSIVVRESTHSLNPFQIKMKEVQPKRALLHTALGRAYIGFCSEPERAALLERAKAADPEGYDDAYVARIVEKTLENGYASERMATNMRVGAIALPIRHEGRVAACIDVNWIYSAMPFDTAVEKFLPHLQWAQGDIEARLAGLHRSLARRQA